LKLRLSAGFNQNRDEVPSLQAEALYFHLAEWESPDTDISDNFRSDENQQLCSTTGILSPLEQTTNIRKISKQRSLGFSGSRFLSEYPAQHDSLAITVSGGNQRVSNTRQW